MKTLLIIISTLIVVFNTIICFAVIHLVNRVPLLSGGEDIPAPGGSQDMRMIADRLQDVVDSLRHK